MVDRGTKGFQVAARPTLAAVLHVLTWRKAEPSLVLATFDEAVLIKGLRTAVERAAGREEDRDPGGGPLVQRSRTGSARENETLGYWRLGL